MLVPKIFHGCFRPQPQPPTASVTETPTEEDRYFSRIKQLVNVDSGDSIAIAAALAEKDEKHRGLALIEPVQNAWKTAGLARPQGPSYDAARGRCLSCLSEQIALARGHRSAPELRCQDSSDSRD